MSNLPAKTMVHTAELWRARAMQNVYASFDKMKIGGAYGMLKVSMAISIMAASPDDLKRVKFSFLYYGRYVDMGVGREFPIGSRGKLGLDKFLEKRNKIGQLVKNPGRKPKQFYTKTIMHEGHRLHELLVKQFGIKMMTTLEESLKGGEIIFKI